MTRKLIVFFRSSNMRKVFLIFIAVFVFSFGYALGDFRAGDGEGVKVTINREIPPDKALDFSLFWDVWDILEEQYYDSSRLQETNMVYGAIKGMVASLGDPYTTFLTPSENNLVEEDMQGNFDGVGIQIGFRGTQLAVISPLPGTPAEQSGIEAGDFIVGIKDEERGIDRGTFGISLQEAVRVIRGPAGTKVTLMLLREGVSEPLMVDVIRGRIEVPSVTLSFEGEGESVAHVKLMKFGGETEREWNKVVSEILKKRNLKGIVLDMRGNPGGYLQGAVDLGSDFLEAGEVVVIEDRGKKKYDYKVERRGRLIGENVVVLVDGGSASASEILAGALRDQLGTKIVGEATFGKGTIQERQEISGGVALHVTSAKWLTPNGIWINETGLEPDVVIEDNIETVEDEQLLEAMKLVYEKV